MARRKVILFFLFIILFPCGKSWAASFVDETGRKVEVKTPPRRIISVAPSITEILFALGLGDKIVGVTNYCNYPLEAAKKAKIGGYVTPSLEKIVALDPDLIIGSPDGNLKTFADQLEKLGIPVFFSYPKSISEVITSIENIGEITFSRRPASILAASLREKIQMIEKKIQGRTHPRVLHVVAQNPLISSGKGTFADDLIRLAGGVNIAENTPGSYPRLSLEEVLARNPEVIILSSMNSNDLMEDQKQWWKQWKTISAVQLSRILVINSDLILRPSPRIVDGLEELARAIHPEAFWENPNSKTPNLK